MENEGQGHEVKNPRQFPLEQGGRSPKILYTFFSSLLSQRFSIVYVLNARFTGVKPRREVEGCLCGQEREGGKDFLLQNKAKLLITKFTNVLLGNADRVLYMWGFMKILHTWGNCLNPVMVSLMPYEQCLTLVLRKKQKQFFFLFLSLSFSASKINK